MRNQLSRKKGYTLAVLVIVIAIIMVIGAALLVISTTEFNFAAREANRIQAYYTARSGAEAIFSYINDTSKSRESIAELISINSESSAVLNDFPSANTLGNGFKVWMSGDVDAYWPVIHSEGIYRDSMRKVTIETGKISFFTSTVNVLESLTVGQDESGDENHHAINGDVTLINGAIPYDVSGKTYSQAELESMLGDEGAVFDSEYSQEFMNLLYSWESFVLDTAGKDSDYLSDNTVHESLADDYAYDPDNYTLEDPESLFEANYDCDYAIKVDSDHQIVYLEGSEIYNNENIVVYGDNELWLFVDDFSLRGNLFLDGDTKVIIFIRDNGSVSLQTGNTSINAIIFGPKADVSITSNVIGLGGIFAANTTITSQGSISRNADLPLYPEDFGLPSFGYEVINWIDD